MYSVEWSEAAAKSVRKLPQEEQENVFKKVESIREYPFSSLKRLKGSRFWRLRVGKHRAVNDVIIVEHRLFVVRIGKRDDIYKS